MGLKQGNRRHLMVSTASQESVPALRLSASGRSKRRFYFGTRGKEPNTDSQYNYRVAKVIPQGSSARIDHSKRKAEDHRGPKADCESGKNVAEEDSDAHTEDRRCCDGNGDISARSGYGEILSREFNTCRSNGACHESVDRGWTPQHSNASVCASAYGVARLIAAVNAVICAV